MIEWFPHPDMTAEEIRRVLDLARRQFNVIDGHRNARYFHRKGFKRRSKS